MPQMTEKRKGEIALMLIEKQILDRGIPSPDTLKREVGNKAAEIKVSTEELMEFYELFVPKILGRAFGWSSVGITYKGKRSE